MDTCRGVCDEQDRGEVQPRHLPRMQPAGTRGLLLAEEPWTASVGRGGLVTSPSSWQRASPESAHSVKQPREMDDQRLFEELLNALDKLGVEVRPFFSAVPPCSPGGAPRGRAAPGDGLCGEHVPCRDRSSQDWVVATGTWRSKGDPRCGRGVGEGIPSYDGIDRGPRRRSKTATRGSDTPSEAGPRRPPIAGIRSDRRGEQRLASRPHCVGWRRQRTMASVRCQKVP